MAGALTLPEGGESIHVGVWVLPLGMVRCTAYATMHGRPICLKRFDQDDGSRRIFIYYVFC